jgi:hypothetical protein
VLRKWTSLRLPSFAVPSPVGISNPCAERNAAQCFFTGRNRRKSAEDGFEIRWSDKSAEVLE